MEILSSWNNDPIHFMNVLKKLTFKIHNHLPNTVSLALDILEEFRTLTSGDSNPLGGRDPYKLD